MSTIFIEPLDVLFLRGNKLFGDPGSYGEALIPPLPSVAAGAIRSRMLVDAGINLAAFARNEITHPALGTPAAPGSFTVTAFHLARREKNGEIVPLFAPPADLMLSAGENFPQANILQPTQIAQGIETSFPFSRLPVLAQKTREKPQTGWWLTAAGWKCYLDGELPNQAEHWVKSTDLWKIDERIGIGMNATTRSVEEGKLFSMQAIAFHHGIGFVVTTQDGDVPSGGSLRFGGDGRAASVTEVSTSLPEPDYAAILRNKRCRLVLTAPGLFEQGWLPTGATETMDFNLHGVRGKIVSAAVPRAEIVSGWDLAKWQPKTAQRAAPVGSVYWLEHIEADEAALRKLVTQGLWQTPNENATRRAEGFNRCILAACIAQGE